MEHQAQQLSELVDARTGYVRGKTEANPEGRYAVVEPSGIESNGDIRYDSLTRTNNIEPSERHLLNEGDVLFIPRGAKNTAALVSRPLSSTTASSQLYILRARAGLEPGYLAWYLNQPRAQAYFENFARGSTIRSINQDILGRLPVPVPPVERQRQIAHVALLARREAELNRELQAKRDHYIQNLLIQAARS